MKTIYQMPENFEMPASPGLNAIIESRVALNKYIELLAGAFASICDLDPREAIIIHQHASAENNWHERIWIERQNPMKFHRPLEPIECEDNE